MLDVVNVDEVVATVVVNEDVDDDEFVILEKDEVVVDEADVDEEVEVVEVVDFVVGSAVGTLLRKAGSGLPAMVYSKVNEDGNTRANT